MLNALGKAKAHSAMSNFLRASLSLAFSRLHTCTDIEEKVCALSPVLPNPCSAKVSADLETLRTVLFVILSFGRPN